MHLQRLDVGFKLNIPQFPGLEALSRLTHRVTRSGNWKVFVTMDETGIDNRTSWPTVIIVTNRANISDVSQPKYCKRNAAATP
jgi:hypothetical protein